MIQKHNSYHNNLFFWDYFPTCSFRYLDIVNTGYNHHIQFVNSMLYILEMDYFS